MAVAVVERFKKELMYLLAAETKKSGRCREVAVVERRPYRYLVFLYVLLSNKKITLEVFRTGCIFFSKITHSPPPPPPLLKVKWSAPN